MLVGIDALDCIVLFEIVLDQQVQDLDVDGDL